MNDAGLSVAVAALAGTDVTGANSAECAELLRQARQAPNPTVDIVTT